MNTQLSIVIPTYNRSIFLNRCLELLVPTVRVYDISIYISDNCSTDNTRSVVDGWILKYPHIEYHCTNENVGADKNFELALKMSDTEYIWLLGDTYHIKPESIVFIFELIRDELSDFDLIVLNAEDRVKGISGGNFYEKNKLLTELGWHMTCMSSLIYSRNLISDANFSRYRDSNFIQTGIIFEYIEERDFIVHWIPDHSVFSIVIEGILKNSWQQRTFEIWVEKWSNFVFSLPPSYDIKNKLSCIKAHGERSNIFSFVNLLILRQAGVFDTFIFKRYRYLFGVVIDLPISLIFCVSIFPKVFIRWMRFFLKYGFQKI